MPKKKKKSHSNRFAGCIKIQVDTRAGRSTRGFWGAADTQTPFHPLARDGENN